MALRVDKRILSRRKDRQDEIRKHSFEIELVNLLVFTRSFIACDCDPAGSIGGGECETVTNGGSELIGRCLCKQNAGGTRCDKCKNGFWNMLESNENGCQCK